MPLPRQALRYYCEGTWTSPGSFADAPLFCKMINDGQQGAVVPLHRHANERITWITQGEAEVYSQGKKYVMHAGDIMIIPPNVPHEFRFTRVRSISISSRRSGETGWTGRQTSWRSASGQSGSESHQKPTCAQLHVQIFLAGG
jgi:mannose-6-phosphate isomerase-like protein (cupin superfamily)